MKYFIFSLFLHLVLSASGQKSIQPTDSFTILGEIKTEKTVRASDLLEYPNHKIGSLTITNHLGEKKSTLKKLRGVKLLDVMKDIEMANENPKLWSEYYLVFVASDGYKVVFSWNEVFNSSIGEQIYLLTELNGKNILDLPDRIIVVTTTDYRTGRRFVKGLSQIQIRKI